MAETKSKTQADASANGKGNPEDVSDEIVVVGSSAQLSLDIGGKRPTSSSLRLMGGKITVDGQFKKGDTVEFSGVARITEAGGVDTLDLATSKPVSCERRHRARIIDLDAQLAGS